MIEIDNLTRRYGDAIAVDAVNMTVETGTITVIVGTSGSGKSTLLRMINRLEEPSSGEVRINGQSTTAMTPHLLRRRIGYAIQGHGLFPHHSVARNIGAVPRLLGWPKDRIAARVDELLDLFSMPPGEFRDRYPAELSGGQQQRVGVARALASRPDLLLMDEPFGALDPIIRARAQDDLLRIQRHLGSTVILVTHDMEEAIRLGDRVAVLDAGKLVQYAPPAQIIAAPANDFVAQMLGEVDRPLRLLSLIPVSEIVEPGEAQGPPIEAGQSLREALSACLWSGRDALPVAQGGRVTLAAIRARAEHPT
ncbi:ABC transporter ATP-binding protein [Paracoccus homiensis]|uniref:Osmoprotectant transport system ATP-binding protein n=1 Tax=Paracoccus homiensis TaxID=364199 RepID=A0A1I0HXD5_9RHOB|nr:ABC transporter ATP-binding protein [Paracoccus homiensis]SET88750.1 osmoprotectant transport system ATP-binding protein [Paracoccus homiensis]